MAHKPGMCDVWRNTGRQMCILLLTQPQKQEACALHARLIVRLSWLMPASLCVHGFVRARLLEFTAACMHT